MTELIWVRDDVVQAIHSRQIAEHGGLDGLRDAGLLSSALSRPKQRYALKSPTPDLEEIAAAYAFGLAKNHPFRDGNKRSALVVSQLFLELNGKHLQASQEDKYEIYLQLAAGELSEEQLASWMRTVLAPT